MLAFYRGHVITLLVDGQLSAEIARCIDNQPLPTKVTSTLDEGEGLLMERVRRLIDLYLEVDDPDAQKFI